VDIEWTQVIIAFILGVLLSAMVKAGVSSLKAKAGG
jgi:hypothetical protein